MQIEELNSLWQKYRKQLTLGGIGVVGILILLFASFVIGVSYPTWYQNLPFKDSVPDWLKPQTEITSVSAGGETTIRTVEESAVIDVVDKTSAAVVSIVAKTVSFDP